METHRDSARDLVILEEIEQNPDATQASLAGQLGVAVGTVNWHLKRLVSKGYVKVRRAERRKLRYLITPEGLALRAHLTIDFIHTSFQLYRATRERVIGLLAQVHQAGYHQVYLEGEGEVAEVCRLTCLEQGVAISGECNGSIPSLLVRGMKVFLQLNEAAQ